MPVHLTSMVLSILAIALAWVPWPALPLLSLLIGVNFAGLTFLGHETLHGAVVRGRWQIRLVGWIGFLPFVVSPRLWIAWHNRVHHGHTNEAGVDPDAYPTLDEYRQNRSVRVATDFASPGRERFAGSLSLLIGFSIQSAHMLFSSRRRGFFSAREHRKALLETALGVACWTTVALLIGPLAFLFAYFLPLLLANSIVMAFILTNHSLSPLTPSNDALVNSLSVTAPPWVEWLTLGFGYHVEHHVFPGMSTRHAPEVRAILRSRFPDRYQSMPIVDALLALHRTARVYKTDTTLLDPHSGREWQTLGPNRFSVFRPAVEPVHTSASVDAPLQDQVS